MPGAITRSENHVAISGTKHSTTTANIIKMRNGMTKLPARFTLTKSDGQCRHPLREVIWGSPRSSPRSVGSLTRSTSAFTSSPESVAGTVSKG